jgi:hypothetical protein
MQNATLDVHKMRVHLAMGQCRPSRTGTTGIPREVRRPSGGEGSHRRARPYRTAAGPYVRYVGDFAGPDNHRGTRWRCIPDRGPFHRCRRGNPMNLSVPPRIAQ